MTPAISCKQLILRLNDTVHDFPIIMMAHAVTLSAAPIQLMEHSGVWKSTQRVAGETINSAVSFCCYNTKEEHR